MSDKCRVCSATGPQKLDQFYRQSLCVIDWERRKADAIANKHGEWLAANGCMDELADIEQGDANLGNVSVESRGDEEIPGR